jgi:hypothetical protein
VTTLTGTLGKSSVAPPAPTTSAPVWANIANVSTYNVTVNGQADSIANVIISDGQLPIAEQDNGMDFVAATGSVVVPVDVTSLVDGPITISVTLTNGSGNSYPTTLIVSKDTIAPALSVLQPIYIGGSIASLFAGENGTTVSYSISDGTTTLTDSKFFNGSTKWQPNVYVGSLKDGPVTLTVTETDPAGNPTVVVSSLVKETVGPGGSFTIAGSTINSVVATANATLALNLGFTATSGIGTVAFSTNGGSTYGAAQAYAATASLPLTGADGLYTIAVQVTSNAGNVATYAKQVRLDRTGPTITTSMTAPTNAGSYDTGQAVALTYSASDTDNVTSASAVLDGTTSIASGVAFNTETFAAGTHTIVITAKDGLGNISTTTITLTVHATVAGLTTAVNDGVTHAQITSSSVATQLKSYLTSAQSALNANNHASAKTYLASFVSLVQAQSGISISAAYAALLVSWAQDLIGRL